MKRTLEMKDLADLDGGRVGINVNNSLATIAHSLKKRPGDDTPRKLLIEIEFIPVMNDEGQLDSADCRASVATKLPKYRAGMVSLGLSDDNNEMLWNDHSEDNVHQHTLDESEAE